MAFEVELVVWEDAYSVDHWSPAMDFDLSPALVQSVGVVVKEDDSRLALAGSVRTDTPDMACTMVIPKSLITSRTKLTPVL